MPKFNMKFMLETIVRYQLREVTLVPPLLIRMVEDPIVSGYDLSCIRIFSSGSAPTPPRILKLLQAKFPKAGFKQGWGMTESCSCLTAHDPAHYNYEFSDTVGPIVANTELMFVDESGKEVIGEGEILARGPQCAMAYLDNPCATRETFGRDGWLRTGDLGRMLPNGCVQITGRLKEIIKVKGVGVAPVELEELLLSHPSVLDVAVIGLSDEYNGETPHACVVVTPSSQASAALAAQLVEFVKAQKLRTKWISGVSFIKEVPRVGSGKILRRELKGQLQKLRTPMPNL
jgi:4-coumarate--CoA ligase